MNKLNYIIPLLIGFVLINNEAFMVTLSSGGTGAASKGHDHLQQKKNHSIGFVDEIRLNLCMKPMQNLKERYFFLSTRMCIYVCLDLFYFLSSSATNFVNLKTCRLDS